jgi:molecular chaperone Hsp33
MLDSLTAFHDSEQRLIAAVAYTTEVCRAAQAAHCLARTSNIALGRLLTASALTGLLHKKGGGVSLQLISQGHLGQMYADVTPAGHLRGYVRNPTISLSSQKSTALVRHAIAAAVGRGVLSVIRMGDGNEFTQSSVDLASGEVDGDVEFFCETSDQIKTIIVCDVLCDAEAQLAVAGGILIQALPETDAGVIDGLRGRVHQEFAAALAKPGATPISLVQTFLPCATSTVAPVALSWQCRCSTERVKNSLRLLPPEDLAKMVDSKEDAQVRCDFCSKNYVVTAAEVEEVFITTITARG